MAVFDPVYEITPNAIDGVRRSSDPSGILGLLVVSPGNLSVLGRNVVLSSQGENVLIVTRGSLVVEGLISDLNTRFIATPGQLTVSGQDVPFVFDWAQSPAIVLTGVGDTYDLNDDLIGGPADFFDIDTGTLPTHVSLDTSTGILTSITADTGTTSEVGPLPVTFAATKNTSEVADWNARTAPAAVLLAENFSSYNTTAELVASEGYGGAGGSPTLENGAVPTSGKACQITREPSDTQSGDTHFLLLSGTSSVVHYKRLYVQVDIYFHGDDLDWPVFVSGGSGTVGNPKIFLIDSLQGGPPASPQQYNEIVVTNERCAGFIGAYRKGGTSPPFAVDVNTPFGNINERQPAIDTGTPANPTNEDDWNRRYGFTRATGSIPSDGSRLSTQGLPHPPSVEAGGIFHPNDKTVFEVFFDYDADTCQIWAAKYGDPAQLIIDFQGGAAWRTVDEINDQHWDHINLANFVTNGQSEVGIRPQMIRQYLEVISSTEPIAFPMQGLPPGHLG